MQISSTPLKWTIPFAQNDGAKVEVPATTADPTRFSLSLGSPPLTGQPPESGGVPPQLEDFNGAFNQIARFTWWAMGGGPLPYDGTWAADSNVNGYANGAHIPSADLQGSWLSAADNNTNNPDTVGTNWLPGYAYGRLALTGLSGGTTTLTPAQALKRTMTLTGTLSSNLTLVLPAWLLEWTITNSTTGNFTVTAKTAAGAGVLIPQNSLPTPVVGDGTNITQPPRNVGVGSSVSSAVQFSQLVGTIGSVRKLLMNVTTASATATLTADEIVVGDALSGGRLYVLGAFSRTINLATTGAGGMDTGAAPVSGYVALYAIYNPTTNTTALLGVNATSTVAPTVYGGANMPSGFTASGLIGVWPTNGSSQFIQAYQMDRRVSFPINTVLTTSTTTVGSVLSISGAVPPNARNIRGSSNAQNTSATTSTLAVNIAADSTGAGQQFNQGGLPTGQLVQNFTLDLRVQQSLFYIASCVPTVTSIFAIYITGYEI